MTGYVNSKLAYFNVTDFIKNETGPDASHWKIDNEDSTANVTFCRYSGYYGYNSTSTMGNGRYLKTSMYWRVLLARVCMVIVFEVCIY